MQIKVRQYSSFGSLIDVLNSNEEVIETVHDHSKWGETYIRNLTFNGYNTNTIGVYCNACGDWIEDRDESSLNDDE